MSCAPPPWIVNGNALVFIDKNGKQSPVPIADNLEIIAAAVNWREQLLKVVKKAAKYIEQLPIDNQNSEVLGNLFAAIKKAEER